MSSRKYQLVKSFSLACAHQIPGAGKCAQIHGHNYRVTFCVVGEKLDTQDMLIDFREVKHALEKRYDHQFLNQFPEFDPAQGGVNPTTERLAEVFYHKIGELCQKKANRPRVQWVKVSETEEAYAFYSENEEVNIHE